MEDYRHSALQYVMDEFADAHEELEDACDSLDILMDDMSTVLDEIRDDIERVREQLDKCESACRSYIRRMSAQRERKTQKSYFDEEIPLPFPEVL